MSLGCAVENLAQAALAHGFKATAVYNEAIAQGDGGAATSGVQVALEPSAAIASPLFSSIPERQCTRTEFDGKPVSNAELKMLRALGVAGHHPGYPQCHAEPAG